MFGYLLQVLGEVAEYPTTNLVWGGLRYARIIDHPIPVFIGDF